METTVNQRIKLLRTQMGLSQSDFADKIGLSREGLSRLEGDQNKASFKTQKKICEAFNVNRTWLSSGSGDMFLKQNESAKVTEVETPWKDEAYKQLKEEVNYLREMLKMALGKGGANANFRKALDYAGVPFGMISKGTFSGACLGK